MLKIHQSSNAGLTAKCCAVLGLKHISQLKLDGNFTYFKEI